MDDEGAPEPANSPVLHGIPHSLGVRSRADLLAGDIDRRIQEQNLHPGTLLGTLDDLRGQTGYAKSTVSEAVRLLRDRGVLEIRPGRGGGLFVASRGPVVRLRHTLLQVDDEPTTVVDAIELRDHLELLIDIGAARCRADDEIADLRACVAKMGTAEDWDGFMQANWELHHSIAQICPNAMARAVYTSTLGHISASSSRHLDDAAGSAIYRHERHAIHVELVEAIASRDEDQVRAAVARHNTTS